MHEGKSSRLLVEPSAPRSSRPLAEAVPVEEADTSARPNAEARVASLYSSALGSVELLLYIAVGLLLAVAALLILGGTFANLIDDLSGGPSAVNLAVTVLDRVLLVLIVGELVYTLRYVLRTHEIAVEPFLYIGMIAVVRRILIVTAEFERGTNSGRALTNILLEFGLLGILAPALALAVFLVRRGRATD
jgi:uncharacterized membrane protein (DUF373 family)